MPGSRTRAPKTPLMVSRREKGPQVVQALVRPPEVIARPVLAQGMEVHELRVLEKRAEGFAGGPLDQDHDAARLHLGLLLQRPVEEPEGDNPPVVLGYRRGRAARVP